MPSSKKMVVIFVLIVEILAPAADFHQKTPQSKI
jgi:hypothetical protein